MRPLSEQETKVFFEKLAKYIGRNIKFLIDRDPETWVFRINKDRVYYANDELVRRVTNVSREGMASLGVCFGKFTKAGKFRLHITCLDYLAQYAKYKVWVKPSQELSFLRGNHILKSGLGRITEDTPEHQGVVVFNMADVPLGFGITAKSTQECRKVDATTIVCIHQADTGEYLRDEDGML
eukprot:TRINITY_DN32849_c0_g1_i1.p1 TRINITY_DN32849_c0_g1~~TRINITY_DN32849_c0_g1_i1.p1  ORF type:complete len:181 (-),score=33.66 TRINITY_DN32849_c0_g1_i1:157-699(-)